MGPVEQRCLRLDIYISGEKMKRFELQHRDFRRIDLNLLVAFDALIQERHVGKAAARIFIGQPGMSHLLARLRNTFDDPLFVRARNEMEPTELARQLAPHVRSWLDDASRFLILRKDTDPSTAHAIVRIALLDGLETVLLPGLLDILQTRAPGIKVWSKSLTRDEISEALDNNQIDLAIDSTDISVCDWHKSQPLGEFPFQCVYSVRQFQLPDRLPLATIAAHKHIALSWGGESGSEVDRLLAIKGYCRDIVVGANSQMAICRLLEIVPVITIQPAIYTSIYQTFSHLRITAIDEPEFISAPRLIWHRRNDNNFIHRFIREQIQRVVDKTLQQRR